MDKNVRKKVENPRENANPLSVVTFAWMVKIFFSGYTKDAEAEDLYSPLKEHSSEYLGSRAIRIWEDEERRCSKRNPESQPKLLKVLLRCFAKDLFLLGFSSSFTEIVIRVLQPLILGKLLDYFDLTVGMTLTEGYIWAAAFYIQFLVENLFIYATLQGLMHLGMKIRIACCALIYRKVLKLSNGVAELDTSAGQMVNLLSTDVNSMDLSAVWLHYLWIGPVSMVFITYLMYLEVGWKPTAVGIATLLLFVPLEGYLGKKVTTFTKASSLRTDKRLNLMNEMINGLKVIKMYTWEKPFALLVEQARRKEMRSINQNNIVGGITKNFDTYIPRLCVFVATVMYASTENTITAKKAFVISSFFSVLRYSMTIGFPISIFVTAKARVAVRRMQKFLTYPEFTKSTTAPAPARTSLSPSTAISLKNVCARWASDSTDNVLTDINLSIGKGKLIAIIGPVGSGKSSLLHLLLHELPLQSGTFEISSKNLSYASQEPWIFASSVRQNILFGRKMDKQKYEKVLRVCQLERDISLFSHGDQTVVGSKGTNLSGGQKARINLARAVYADADIYLFDDPLSAVDTLVGRRIVEECITGYLKGKTVVLVTHQIQYLKNADEIVLLESGRIQNQGSFVQLQAMGLDFLKFTKDESLEESSGYEKKSIEAENPKNGCVKKEAAKQTDSDPLDMAEEKIVGSIKGGVYWSYLKSCGSLCLILSVVGFSLITQLAQSSGDYFLSFWVNLEERQMREPNGTTTLQWLGLTSQEWCIYIYTGITVLTVIFSIGQIVAVFQTCAKCSKGLHSAMFENIVRAKMYFFNANPGGRILNRFSRDMATIDNLIPETLVYVIQMFLIAIAVVLITLIVIPWLVLPLLIVAILAYFIRLLYIGSSRNLKRLEGITRSPVFDHLSASLQGLTTIRAFQAEEILTKEFYNHMNLHSTAWFLFFSSSRTFGLYLEIVCLTYVGIITFVFIIFRDNFLAGDVGLIITQCLSLSMALQWGMRQFSELENQMTSVERILEYTRIEQEPPLESAPGKGPPKNWPERGKLEFKNVNLKYHSDSEYILKNLSFVISPNEKIGIVGRTGAGKSSLINAIFRLAEFNGDILIDEVSITSMGLHDLRAKISIIPQEPVFFTGSLRRNLDPFNEYSDQTLWQALEDVQLKKYITETVSGLDCNVSDGGSNFSVGQRQLLCLARAILRNNKILILDEATANVDPLTDELIQITVREKFVNCTVLTIAHRLNTIMDSDKVLIMDNGCVVEFDRPYVLLQRKCGFFYDMVQETGPFMAKTLTEIAEKKHNEEKNSAVIGNNTNN